MFLKGLKSSGLSYRIFEKPPKAGFCKSSILSVNTNSVHNTYFDAELQLQNPDGSKVVSLFGKKHDLAHYPSMIMDGGHKLLIQQRQFSQFLALEERNNIESAINILLNNKRRSCTVESYNVEGCQVIVKSSDDVHQWTCTLNFADLPLATTPQSYDGFTYFNFIAVETYASGCIMPERIEVATIIRPGLTFNTFFTAKPQYCLLQPVLQRIFIENVEFCVEHRHDPIRCFAGDHARPFLKFSDERKFQPFASVDDFKIRALSNLILETAESHTEQPSKIVKFKGVSIHLSENDESNRLRGKLGTLFVKFHLPCTLCRSRRINFCRSGVQLGAIRNDLVRDLIQMDHFCISVMINNSSCVLHCSSVDVEKISAEIKEESQFVITARVTYTSTIIPLGILPSIFENCVIEYLPILMPARLMIQAMAKLDEISWCNSDLVKLILGTYVPSNKQSIELNWNHCPVTPNEEQKEAVERSLSEKIWFIWGPPGTGKSDVVVMAAYHAVQENMRSYTQRLKPVLTPLRTYGDDIEPPIQAEVEDEKARKFVTLVTAPSNAAVDNILARLIRHQFTERQHCKIVRVYSTEIEQLDFPEPRRERRSMTFCINVDHRQYALHHQLRQNVRFGEKIRNYDIENRRKYLELVHNSNMPEPDQDESFLRVIKEGEKEILRDADIILTTCSTANWIRLKPVIRSQSFDQHGVRQLIIDEAGHSTITETLIPLCTAMNADNIVLIGDPKQLRPVLKSKDAQAFKFDYSLLDIYVQEKGISTMLKRHYRMHEDIAAFPSVAFYKDQLVIEQPDIQRSRNLASPFKWADNNAAIFLHCNGGDETSNTMVGEDHSAKSRHNPAQQKTATRLIAILMSHANINQEDICVITVYRRQKNILQRQLKTSFPKVNICTVESCQGLEWPYVILMTVRASEGPIGKIGCPNHLNVAITRAQKGLIILGNKNFLTMNREWKNLIDFYQSNNWIHDAVNLLGVSGCSSLNFTSQDYMDQPSEIVVNVDNDIISAKAKTSTPRKRKEVPRKAANFLDATLSMSGINPSFDNDKLFFLGNHAIEIDSLMEPPLEWIDREINQHHVDFLFNFFCEKPSSIFSMSPWLVIIKATRGQFDPNKVHLFEKVLIGGRHRKLALQKLKVERPEIFTSMWRNNIIHATCYSSEMPSELIALKAMENNIDNRQGLKSDWFDRVVSCRKRLWKAADRDPENYLVEQLPQLSPRERAEWRKTCSRIFTPNKVIFSLP